MLLKRTYYLLLCLLGFCLTSSLAVSAETQILKRHSDWTSYKSGDGKEVICFAASIPKDSEPKNVNRDDIYFYVSSWPSHKIKEEISIKIGYPLRPGSKPTAQIDDQTFTLYPRGDKMFISDSDEDAFVKAMRKGKKMIIKGLSKRGTNTTDVYSLMGISSALETVHSTCRN